MLQLGTRRWAKNFRSTPLHPQWLLGSRRLLSEWVALHSTGRVLDIGCSDQWIAPYLRRSCSYVGLDYPPTGIGLYSSSADVYADATSLPFADGCIDTVLMLDVLEHLRFPRQAMDESFRVLGEEGKLLLSVPFMYPLHDAPHDYQRYTVHGLIREVEASGFRLRSVKPALGALHSAGLLLSLSLAGTGLKSIEERHWSVIFLPLLLFAIPLINICVCLLARITPSWPAMTAGYILLAVKR